MRFQDHSELKDTHAYLSASSPAWINYDDEKFDDRYIARLAAAKGTRLHHLAHLLISEGEFMPRTKRTLHQYVNDCIRWRMKTEVVLFFSYFAYGTADAISFLKGVLRISDLKTGVNEASFTQLELYAALFCLEYDYNPFEIAIELRIYQNDAVKEVLADPDRIMHLMDRYKIRTKRIEELREELL